MSSPPAARARNRGWPLGARATALLLVGCVATGVIAGVVFAPGSPSTGPISTSVAIPAGALKADAVWPAGTRAAPPLALRDQDGQLVSLAAQRGRVVLLAFMDSHCKLICTFEGPMISLVQKQLPPRTRLTVLVVSVNPWQDTPASTRQIAAKWGIGGDWHWLLGSAARLAPIWRAYGMVVVRTAGDVSHSTAIYLIDPRGFERAGFNWPFTAPAVKHHLRALLATKAS